ncbi:helicase-related protein [Gleimia hominis]|uniref:Helicase-related protein n=1 Tax=Gleimia hominis TaxID=595468 RepID=A0ABU3I8Y8_9ACTO|nr:helicase-related protein [Gleimia hominis]MDT3766834.1 helicase-related protein [Gleimia hominis]
MSEQNLMPRGQNATPDFTAPPEEFRLAAEALRIKYAALYNPLAAVESSNIDPLPHQIRAVYEDLLPKYPLRFLLADDPGAGKTIMAGLYIKEMLMRSAANRVLIVCPGGLATQWCAELEEKFGLEFKVFDPSLTHVAKSSNPFEDYDRLIVRMDQVARNEKWRKLIGEVLWDITVVDEAHRMSASFKNVDGDVSRTNRFKLGEVLSECSENFLLMTATPHSGKEESFQLFMSLLDKDRFAGKFKKNVHGSADTKDLMRRVVKERLLTFEGKPLFPERQATTVMYPLSEDEHRLYDSVTKYVRDGMNSVAQIMSTDRKRANSIGFALTMLQRRLASSPAAILRSLQRRRSRLNELLDHLRQNPDILTPVWQAAESPSPQDSWVASMDALDDEWDEMDVDSQDVFEREVNAIVDSSTGAQTLDELQAEIGVLDDLVEEAKRVRALNSDEKWAQLRQILQDKVLDYGSSQLPHKLIVFTEHKDTLDYLQEQIGAQLGQPEAVEVIHGGLNRAQRLAVQERFINDPAVRVLVATDAAGEGLNLQRADLMVNYDLPWNPNKIEQRFGRIHRIGQKRTCHLWNLVAGDTREGAVYGTLLQKIETMESAYQGRLFNVLGDRDAFNNRPLNELMMDAIRYGDNPQVQQRLNKVVSAGVADGLEKLQQERSAFPEFYSKLNVNEIREQMERARERKLQPGYISAFFLSALKALGGQVRKREKGRYEVVRVPGAVRDKARELDRQASLSVAYERITFDPQLVHVPGLVPDALLVAPGVLLLDAVVEATVERFEQFLNKGTVFVDRTENQPDEPILMLTVDQQIDDDRGEAVSRHFDYLYMTSSGHLSFSKTPPYLDYEAATPKEWGTVKDLLAKPWLKEAFSGEVQAFAYEQGGRDKKQALERQMTARNRHVLRLVRSRLTAESEYWFDQYNRKVDTERDSRPRGRMSAQGAFERAKSLQQRLFLREKELSPDVKLHLKPAAIRASALVVPEKMLGSAPKVAPRHAVDTQVVDRRAVDAVLAAEQLLGRKPREMPHNNKGFDIESVDSSGVRFFIEVKGRIDEPGADTFSVTANEVAFGRTQGTHYRLALVRVSPDGAQFDRLRYVRDAFAGFDTSPSTHSFTEKWRAYWDRGGRPV